MRYRLFKKFMVLNLVVMMFLGLFPQSLLSINAKDGVTVAITHNNQAISSIVVDEDEHKMISVSSSATTVEGYKWQILINNEEENWATIYDMNTKDCLLSYSLLENAVDNHGYTKIRCIVDLGEEEIATEPITVSIGYIVDDSFHQSSEEQSEKPTFNLFKMSTFNSPRAIEYVEIKINYVYEPENEGEEPIPAFDPYVARLPYNTPDFTVPNGVPTPTIVGYDAYYNDVVVNTVPISYQNITENIELTVTYKPALVDYNIRYFLQNTNNDNYTEDVELFDERKGYTGAYPEDVEIDIKGFTALYHDPDTIAADGSTSFHCYYDRNYYLVNFKLNGGYGVEPIYARYGTNFIVNNPLKTGYLFGGWDVTGDGRADTVVTSVPDQNITYSAIWNTTQTTYNLVFWQENADDNGFSYWGQLQVNAQSGTKVSAEDRVDEVENITDEQYFTYNPIMSEKNVIVEGDGSTVVHVYYNRNYYNLYFTGYGECCKEENHVHGENCYDYICGYTHEHDESCTSTVICTKKEHVHSDACCDYDEHHHNSAECNLDCDHPHDNTCYGSTTTASPSNNIQTAITNVMGTPTNGTIYRVQYTSWWTDYDNYYLYYNNGWYTSASTNAGTQIATGETSVGSGWSATDYTVTSYQPVVNCTHTHDDGCYTCDKLVHVHGDGNCTCTKEVHQHTDEECYEWSCQQESHTHTNTCLRLICPETEGHKHTTTCTSRNTSNVVYQFRAKYNSNIANKWPTLEKAEEESTHYKNTSGKLVNASGNYLNGWKNSSISSSTYVSIRLIMEKAFCSNNGITFQANYTSSSTTLKIRYYFECICPEGTTTHTQREYGGKMYDLDPAYSQTVLSSSLSAKSIVGFTNVANEKTTESDGNYQHFYYDRLNSSGALTFTSAGDVIRTETGFKYGESLSRFQWTTDENGNQILYEPLPPEDWEENAWTFAGWYTRPECYEQSKVNWNAMTMPLDTNVNLTAKWVSVSHNVNVYLTHNDMQNKTNLLETQVVPHGNVARQLNNPTRPGYIFVGWFYYKNGARTAYNVLEMPVNSDLNVFAEWTSTETVNYQVHYVEEGTTTPVADSIYGRTFAGGTKTFNAKSGTQLYLDYHDRWYPTSNSHSIVMDLDSSLNTHTFEYVYLEKVPYEVRYVNKITGEVLHTTKEVADNTLAIVTERFYPIKDFVPDSFYKRLVLSANFSENVITFYYLPDEQHAYYAVHHYIQNMDDDGYTEYTSIEAIADLNKTITVNPLAISGFTFDASKSTTSGTVTSDGLVLNLYYNRETYPYIVRYLEYGTDKELHTATTGTDKYGKTLTFTSPVIDGYTVIGSPTKTLEVQNKENMNVVNFYYNAKQYVIRYIPMCTEATTANFGDVTMSIELVRSTGQILGSTPIVKDNYEFVGWYLDEMCTQSVESSLINAADNTLKPDRLQDISYYALFKPIYSSLEISKSGMNNANESSIFVIEGQADNNNHIKLTVSIQGNNSALIDYLPVGEYKVRELDDWCWRYNNANTTKTVTLVKDTKETIAFSNSSKNLTWLGSEVVDTNVFDK